MLSRVLLGLVLGVVLGLGRSQAGFDLPSLPAVPAETAAFARAVTLIVVGAGILLARGLFPARRAAGELLVGVTIGFAGVGLGLGWPRVPAPWWLVLLALVAAVALGKLGKLVATGERDGPGEELAGSPRPALRRAGHAGLALGAAGVALCFDGLMRGLAARGGGLPADDAVFATVLLAAMTLGGYVLSSATAVERRPDGVAALCALTAAASFFGVLTLGGIAPKEGLGASLARVGLELTDEGTLLADAWIGALVLLPPALVCGVALFGARRAQELATLAFGAAAGVVLAPLLMRVDAAATDLSSAPGAMRPILAGAGVAAAGALLGAITARGGILSFPRWAGVAAAVLCGALILGLRQRDLEVELVRGLRPIRPLLVCELPEGQLQVDPEFGGAQLVMLGKRAIAPGAEHARIDDLCLARTFEFAPPGSPVEHVLLVGQLTPRRARVLFAAGVHSVDRSAAWWRAMAGIESLTFEDGERRDGEIVSPQTARERIAESRYDLVVVAPVTGCAPRLRADIGVPQGVTAVAWIDAAADDLARRSIDRPLALVLDGLELPHVGVVWGHEPSVGRAPGRTPILAAGDPLDSPATIARLGLEPYRRPDRDRLEVMLRLEAAARDTVHAGFTTGLRRHAEVQAPSSPFETREQRIEIDVEALDYLFTSCLEAEPDATLREVWDGAARVLRAKRDVGSVYRFLEPIEQTWGPWPELVLSLAHADLEELEHAAALARLATVVTDDTTDAELLSALARAHEDAGDHAAAAGAWRRALAGRPGDHGLERSLGIALLRSGEPEGRAILETILAHDPGDTTVEKLLGRSPADDQDPAERR